MTTTFWTHQWTVDFYDQSFCTPEDKHINLYKWNCICFIFIHFDVWTDVVIIFELSLYHWTDWIIFPNFNRWTSKVHRHKIFSCFLRSVPFLYENFQHWMCCLSLFSNLNLLKYFYFNIFNVFQFLDNNVVKSSTEFPATFSHIEPSPFEGANHTGSLTKIIL